MADMSLILLRIDQIEARLKAKHPRAARDGELIALLRSLRDEAQDWQIIVGAQRGGE